MSKEGICGDAIDATPEFGKLMFETTATRFIEMTREFRTIYIRERMDHQLPSLSFLFLILSGRPLTVSVDIPCSQPLCAHNIHICKLYCSG